MKHRHTLLLAILLLSSLTVVAQNTQEQVYDMIRNVNDTWQKAHPAPEYGGTKKGLSAFWDNAVYHTGNMEAIACFKNNDNGDTSSQRLVAADAWYKYSYAWAEKNNWCGATEQDTAKWLYKKYGEKPQYVLFGDWQICFQTYIDLVGYHDGAANDDRLARAFQVMNHEVRSNATDYWWWADALYMVMPVMSKMYCMTGDEAYIEKMYANWQYANSIMYDKKTGLYFRDGKYVYPKHTTASGKKDFWARGDGWVMAAFAKVFEDIKENGKLSKRGQAIYADMLKYYKKMSDGVVRCQQPEGHWTRSMLDPEQAPGYETSGTALMCYSLFWGVNHGVLKGKKYENAALKAWQYLSTVALQPDNTIGYVQPIGEKAIPGQVVDRHSQSNFGTGAFLLATCEYSKFLKK